MCEVNYEEVKRAMLKKEPETEYEYRRLHTKTQFAVLVTKAETACGISREELAAKSNIDLKHFTEIESCGDTEVTLTEVQQIAMALGCDAKVVFVPHNQEE